MITLIPINSSQNRKIRSRWSGRIRSMCRFRCYCRIWRLFGRTKGRAR